MTTPLDEKGLLAAAKAHDHWVGDERTIGAMNARRNAEEVVRAYLSITTPAELQRYNIHLAEDDPTSFHGMELAHDGEWVRADQAQSALAAVREERVEADNALVDKYRDPKTGHFTFPDDVAAIIARAETAEAQVQRLTEDNEALTALHADCARRLVTAEARIKALESALRLIDAHDPESAVNGCSPDALRGLVNRMGGISRATLNSREKVDG